MDRHWMDVKSEMDYRGWSALLRTARPGLEFAYQGWAAQFVISNEWQMGLEVA